MKKVTKKDIEQLLENLNQSFEPITKEIDNNLKFLYECIGETPHTDFNKITMEDITKD